MPAPVTFAAGSFPTAMRLDQWCAWKYPNASAKTFSVDFDRKIFIDGKPAGVNEEGEIPPGVEVVRLGELDRLDCQLDPSARGRDWNGILVADPATAKRMGAAWRVKYGAADDDRFGGVLALAPAPALAMLREGDEVYVAGKLNAAGAEPRFGVDSVILAK